MIHLNNLKLSFGDQIIFDDISWHIKRQERIGLIGENGAGKTTLFKTILGLQTPDHGIIRPAKAITFGYLPQEAIEVKGNELLDEVLSAVGTLKHLENEIEQLQQKIATTGQMNPAHHQDLQRLGTLQHRFEDLGGFRVEVEAKKILSGMGFTEKDWKRPVETFSGGWQMRIALSKLLLQRPNLLLLDEPTNHLDLSTMEWVESYLQNYPGTIIIISHDRYFLERIVNKIVLLERGRLTEFSGSYSFYEHKRQQMEEQLWQQYERQKEEIARIERFIERFRYKASKASQVQSRIKQLDKIKRIIPPSAQKKVHFYFPTATRSGRIVAELEDVSQLYNSTTIIEDVNLIIEANEKIALVGPNGAGKSTLCRIVAGTEKPTTGRAELGYRVKYAFYTQETADKITGPQSVLDDAYECNNQLEMSKLRTLLGCFLFTNDDVYKPVNVLSGGEKSRLALAKLLLQESNFLILDEPTNHLDEASKAVLQEALQAYQGTLILVSHDRYFLDRVVNKVIEINNGKLRVYLGHYTDYLIKKNGSIQNETVRSDTGVKATKSSSKKSKVEKRLEAEARQQRYRKEQAFELKIKPMEEKIEALESRKAEIETEMSNADFFKNQEQARLLSLEYKQINEELPLLYLEWEKLVT